MSTLLKVLRFAAVLYGAVAATSLVFIGVALLFFNASDPLDPDLDHVRFIERWIGFVWLAGLLFGGAVLWRAARRRKIQIHRPDAA